MNRGVVMGNAVQKTIVRLTVVAALPFLFAQPRAFAVSKEIVQLQTQVQQLEDMLQHLQTTNDERMGVIINLVQQNTDSVNKMGAMVNNLDTALKNESDASGTRSTQLSGQIQALNDSVDELKTRLAGLATQVQNIQSQAQNVTTAPAQSGAEQPGAPGQPGPATQPGAVPQPNPGAPQPQASAAPPLAQLYQSALRDYNAAKYDIAESEFGDVLRYYPQDPLAGNAQFYLGEISYRQMKYPEAIKHYDAVLEQFSGNPMAPPAELRKGQSLLEMGQRDAGVRELRALVQRYPQTPEAKEGRSKLNGLGVRIYPSKPTAYRQ
jgi:tol-pal system protein YbgF